jgi:4'-phosphopantetheinyl transferase EntD
MIVVYCRVFIAHMPLHSLFSPVPGTLIAFWTLEEPESDLLAFTEGRLDNLVVPSHPVRRQEHLAARAAAVHALNMLGYPHSTIGRKDTGAPCVEGLHLSLSHCSGKAAAIVSTEHQVGIDLARYRDTLLRVQSKFLHKNERSFAYDKPLELVRIWAAKEALYKRIGQKGLSLSGALCVLPPFQAKHVTVMAWEDTTFQVHFREWGDSLVAYCV